MAMDKENSVLEIVCKDPQVIDRWNDRLQKATAFEVAEGCDFSDERFLTLLLDLYDEEYPDIVKSSK
jgi:hypothetical protein